MSPRTIGASGATGSDVASAYDGRAEEYVEKLGSVDQMPDRDRATIERWRDGVDGRLLDAGCGPGHWSDLLSCGGRREVLGVDRSACFLDSARRRFPQSAFVRGDLTQLPVGSGSVGGVLAWYSIIHTPPANVPAILSELARVLAPGGSLLLGFFAGRPEEPFDHAVTTAYYWSAAALGDLLVPHGLAVERAETRQGPTAARMHGELVARRVDPA